MNTFVNERIDNLSFDRLSIGDQCKFLHMIFNDPVAVVKSRFLVAMVIPGGLWIKGPPVEDVYRDDDRFNFICEKVVMASDYEFIGQGLYEASSRKLLRTKKFNPSQIRRRKEVLEVEYGFNLPITLLGQRRPMVEKEGRVSTLEV